MSKIKMKKIISFIMILIFLIIDNNNIVFGYELPFKLECEGCYLYNIDTGTVIYEKNKDKKLEPASLVKIMTAVLALEKIKDIDKTQVTAKGYIFDILYGLNGTTAGIVKGETLSVRELLECMLTQSACEAAMMLADAVCPDDIDTFVDLMNAKAKSLGAKNTHFSNPHGLHDDRQFSTAYDMFLISKYAMELPAFMDIVSETSHEISATNKRSEFSVFTTIEPMKESSRYYYPPIRGIKTGTEESGRSFVSSATKDGFNYICCVLCAPYRDEKTNKVISGNKAFEDTIALYKWAFENFKIKTVISTESVISEVKLKYAFNKNYLKLGVEKNISALIDKKTDVSKIEKKFNLPDEVFAPIKKGDIVGTAKLILDGNEITEFNVVAYETVEKNWAVYILSLFGNFFNKVVLKIIILVIVLILFVILVRNFNKNRTNKRKRRKIRV